MGNFKGGDGWVGRGECVKVVMNKGDLYGSVVVDGR